MKISIYNEPYGGSLGGSEVCSSVLASALQNEGHCVTIRHHHVGLTAERLSTAFQVNLSGVALQYVEPQPRLQSYTRDLVRRYKEAADWQSDLSEGCDVFVNFTHRVPPFNHAQNGILVVLFPLHRAGGREAASSALPPLANFLDSSYREWEWKKRVGTYHHLVSISEFTRTWTKAWWGISTKIIYPPSNACFAERPKNNSILSVGRFTTGGHTKKQYELVGAFAHLVSNNAAAGAWTYYSVGNVAASGPDRDYYDSVCEVAKGAPVQLLSNVSREALVQKFEESKIFWHGTGLDEDGEVRPELMEHFGISTVEAMTAGCVPVVIRKGGQSEIVEHGVSGFLWDSLDELREYTLILMQDPELRAKMSDAARERAERFSTDVFVQDVKNLL